MRLWLHYLPSRLLHTNCGEGIRLAAAHSSLPLVLGFLSIFSWGIPPAFASSVPYACVDYTWFFVTNVSDPVMLTPFFGLELSQ